MARSLCKSCHRQLAMDQAPVCITCAVRGRVHDCPPPPRVQPSFPIISGIRFENPHGYENVTGISAVAQGPTLFNVGFEGLETGLRVRGAPVRGTNLRFRNNVTGIDAEDALLDIGGLDID